MEQNKKELKVGGIEEKIPEGLTKIFPEETFMSMRNLPGVYVIYFPLFNKVYIGQSNNVRKRVIRETKNFSLFGSVGLNSYLKESSSNFHTYSVYQGPLCSKEKRQALETSLINQAGEKAINISKNSNQVFNDLIKIPDFKKPNFIRMDREDTWLNYGLPYENTTANPGESYLYAFLNIKSKCLYIGQSSLHPFEKRINAHRQAIRKAAILKSCDMIIQESAVTKMADDVSQGNDTFIYSIIQNLKKAPKSQILQSEKIVINKVLDTNDVVLYNIHKPYVKTGPKNISEYPLNPFIINGVWYNTSPEAMTACGARNYRTLKDRAKSWTYPNIISLKDPANKTIPNDAEIQQKCKDYYARYGAVKNTGISISSPQEIEQSVPPRRLSPYIYKGKWYDNKREAYAEAAKEGMTYGSFTFKTSSPNYPDIISINNPVGKKIPDTPEIKEKLRLNKLYFESYKKRRKNRFL